MHIEWETGTPGANGFNSEPRTINRNRFRQFISEMLSPFWRPQFVLPENGIDELEETADYIDYQGVRIVVLNSNKKIEKQAGWLEGVLVRNPNHWTIMVFHHPVHPTYCIENEKALDGSGG